MKNPNAGPGSHGGPSEVKEEVKEREGNWEGKNQEKKVTCITHGVLY